jgi:hypothetical protein
VSYKLSIQPDHLLVERPPGYQVVLNQQLAMLAELSAVAKEAGRRNVLVLGTDTDVQLSVRDIYTFAEEAAKLRLRVAVVESHDASTRDVNFLENVMWNRGGSIRFFDSEDAARDWLANTQTTSS